MRLWRSEFAGDDGREGDLGEVGCEEMVDRGWMVAGEDCEGESWSKGGEEGEKSLKAGLRNLG